MNVQELADACAAIIARGRGSDQISVHVEALFYHDEQLQTAAERALHGYDVTIGGLEPEPGDTFTTADLTAEPIRADAPPS